MPMSIHIAAADFEELKPVAPGIYSPVTLGKAIFHAAKSEGKFGYFEVPFSFEDDEGKARTMYRNFSLSPKASSFIARLVKALGLAPEEGEDYEFDFDDVEGEQCKVAVKARTWKDDAGEDHLSAEIDKILPV